MDMDVNGTALCNRTLSIFLFYVIKKNVTVNGIALCSWRSSIFLCVHFMLKTNMMDKTAISSRRSSIFLIGMVILLHMADYASKLSEFLMGILIGK